MTVLPYCILLGDSVAAFPETGVLNSRIHQLTERDLLVLYSELSKSDISPKTFQSAALDFHEAVHAVFSHAAVVPFRFPTWLTSPELSKHLQQESLRYSTFLSRHAQHAQMEVRVTPPPTGSVADAKTGTEHLRARAAESRHLRNTAETVKKLLSSEAIEWRERDTPQGFRLYALVDRANIAAFRERLSKCEHQINVRWSGPWPATEFLESPRRSEP